MSRIGFLHTSPVHVSTFNDLLAEVAPESQLVHTVDESLLTDARKSEPESVADRVRGHLRDLTEQGAEIICCTCSTLGALAEQNASGVSVIRVDRPMVAQALQVGRRIAVIAALESTLAPTRALIEEEANTAGVKVDITLMVADGAWDLFEAGDQSGYIEHILQAAREIAPAADVVILAQASMAGAEPFLTDLPVPVFSSPRPAAEYLASKRWR